MLATSSSADKLNNHCNELAAANAVAASETCHQNYRICDMCSIYSISSSQDLNTKWCLAIESNVHLLAYAEFVEPWLNQSHSPKPQSPNVRILIIRPGFGASLGSKSAYESKEPSRVVLVFFQQ